MLLFLCLYASNVNTIFAQTPPPNLVATITGKNHGPKKFIRVEISGPEYKKIATDSNGIISTTLKPGNYIFTIRERSRQMKFKLKVKESGVTKETFVLAW